MNGRNIDLNNFSGLLISNKEKKFLFVPTINPPLNVEIDFYKNGGQIKIKEKNKGTFTKYCGGNVTSECIRRGKNSPDPKIRKKATFAANARKWKHKNGGVLRNYDVDALNKLLEGLRNGIR